MSSEIDFDKSETDIYNAIVALNANTVAVTAAVDALELSSENTARKQQETQNELCIIRAHLEAITNHKITLEDITHDN